MRIENVLCAGVINLFQQKMGLQIGVEAVNSNGN